MLFRGCVDAAALLWLMVILLDFDVMWKRDPAGVPMSQRHSDGPCIKMCLPRRQECCMRQFEIGAT